jgi:hypothetical protein
MLLENVLKLWLILFIIFAVNWFLELVSLGFDRAIRKVLGPRNPPSGKVSFARLNSAVCLAVFGVMLVAVTFMAGYKTVVVEDNSDLSFGVGIFFGWAVLYLFNQLTYHATNLWNALLEQYKAWRARQSIIALVATATAGDTQLAGELVDFVGEKIVDHYKKMPPETP